jgi:hypothetical protein
MLFHAQSCQYLFPLSDPGAPPTCVQPAPTVQFSPRHKRFLLVARRSSDSDCSDFVPRLFIIPKNS